MFSVNDLVTILKFGGYPILLSCSLVNYKEVGWLIIFFFLKIIKQGIYSLFIYRLKKNPLIIPTYTYIK